MAGPRTIAIRRSHYETAFEAYLNRRGTPFVSVEEVRHNVRSRPGIKAFDYLVYPPDGKACLVDVKGRKSPVNRAIEWRQKNWVTRADLEGLTEWQRIFGPDFVAMFVFAHWLAPPAAAREDRVDQLPQTAWRFAGRAYEFSLIPLDAYARHARRISSRWDTVAMPRDAFRNLSERLDRAWRAAPC